MKKLITLVALVCVLNVLTLAGLVGFLAVTGRVDRGKVQTIADLLRHQGTPVNLRDQVYHLLKPVATTAPATAPVSRPMVVAVGGAADPGPAASDERLDYVNQALEQGRMKLEREAQALREARISLDKLRDDVEAKLAQVEAQKKEFERSVVQVAAKSSDGSLQKTLALYDEMKPKQIKDNFMAMTPEEGAKYLDAMAPDRAAKIMAEFKSPDEKTRLNALMDQLRAVGTNSASATRPAGALPAATPVGGPLAASAAVPVSGAAP